MKNNTLLTRSTVSMMAIAIFGLMLTSSAHAKSRECNEKTNSGNARCETPTLKFKKGETLKYEALTARWEPSGNSNRFIGKGRLEIHLNGKRLTGRRVDAFVKGEYRIRKTGWYNLKVIISDPDFPLVKVRATLIKN